MSPLIGNSMGLRHFRFPVASTISRWLALAGFLLSMFSQEATFSAPVIAEEHRLSEITSPNGDDVTALTGIVKDESGAPIEGAAVFVRWVKPRTGKAFVSGDCYAEVHRHSLSDAQGSFRLEVLSKSRQYSVVAVKDGFMHRIQRQIAW